jgi:hypothetical protein
MLTAERGEGVEAGEEGMLDLYGELLPEVVSSQASAKVRGRLSSCDVLVRLDG